MLDSEINRITVLRGSQPRERRVFLFWGCWSQSTVLYWWFVVPTHCYQNIDSHCNQQPKSLHCLQYPLQIFLVLIYSFYFALKYSYRDLKTGSFNHHWNHPPLNPVNVSNMWTWYIDHTAMLLHQPAACFTCVFPLCVHFSLFFSSWKFFSVVKFCHLCELCKPGCLQHCNFPLRDS